MARFQGEEIIHKDIALYISTLRDVNVDITGMDLIGLGYPQGRDIGNILHLMLLAKMEGIAHDKSSQLHLAQRFLEKNTTTWNTEPSYDEFIATLL